jgi:hypothetical protein
MMFLPDRFYHRNPEKRTSALTERLQDEAVIVHVDESVLCELVHVSDADTWTRVH